MIVSNRLLCPDGTIIESRYRHEYVSHEQEDGRTYFIDGGHDYVRCGGTDGEYRVLCVTSDDPHINIREVFIWASYGKDGMSPRREILLKDIDDDHLSNIIKHLQERLDLMIEMGYVETSEIETVISIMRNEECFRKHRSQNERSIK